jgi:hypothetical protein
VGNVEYARRAADGVVLADLGTVLDGHVPATEIDDTSAQLTVKLE